MVDCIVPATGAAEIAAARAFGIEDAAPVTHENYRQWVIEDAFCAGRPDWDRVGAIFTDDVHDYEAMKIRILNAGHQVLANAGELLSLATIADCMADAHVSSFWRKVEIEEIVPYVSAVPGMTPEAYVRLIESRFSNPAIRDTTRRVAFDGSSRTFGLCPADCPGRSGRRVPHLRAGSGRGALGAHVRGHARGRIAHRTERSRLGQAAAPGGGCAQTSGRVAGTDGDLRGSRNAQPFCHRLRCVVVADREKGNPGGPRDLRRHGCAAVISTSGLAGLEHD
jgi:hypothetical protein